MNELKKNVTKRILYTFLAVFCLSILMIPEAVYAGNYIDESIVSASDKADGDWFGNQVCISGDYAIVGAPRAGNSSYPLAGQAYIYHYNGTGWEEQQILTASDKYSGDWFGESVSISGDYAVVGAKNADVGVLDNAGKVYIYHYNGTSWQQQKILTASDKAESDGFGSHVSISGDYVFVGVPYSDPGGVKDAGKTYIYHRSGTSWGEQQILTASDKAASNSFGRTVFVSGDYAVVGAPNANPGGLSWAGKAYVYHYNGTNWGEQQILTASNKAALDQFGCSASISGDYVIVGAFGATLDGFPSTGKACIYHYNGTNWEEQQILTASNKVAHQYYGVRVSISGDYAILGTDRTGKAYICHYNGTNWEEQQVLTINYPEGALAYGEGLYISQDYAVVAASLEPAGGSTTAGKAYFYSYSSDNLVTYNANGGSGTMDPSRGAEGSSITLDANTFTSAGYTFGGWSTTSGGAVEYADQASFTIPTSNTTLYARWISSTAAIHKLTYDGNGSTSGSVPPEASCAENAGTLVLGNTGSLVKAGSTFAGWNTAANGSGTSYPAGSTFVMGTADATLYAQWTPDASATYTLSYDGNGAEGGSAPSDTNSPYAQGANVTVLGNSGSLAKTGYHFGGWNTAANGNGINYAAGSSFNMGASNVSLYAKWIANTATTHTLSYDGNGAEGGSAPTSATNAERDNVLVSANTGSLVKAGSTFAGWNTAANGSGTSYGAGSTFVMGSADTTLYAQWTPDASATHTLSYDGNGAEGGSAPSDTNSPYAQGANVTVLGNSGSLAKTGYHFGGWNTAANGSGTNYAVGGAFDMGTSNVILYAKWISNTAATHTLSYDGNGATGGSAPVSASNAEGDNVLVSGNTGSLVKAGSTFAGWNTAANGSGTSYPAGSTFVMGTADATLYAQWTPDASATYTLSYDGNGAEGGSAPSDTNSPYAQGANVTVLGNTGSLVKSAYHFGGWNTAANGSGTNYAAGNTFTMGTAPVTLYAVWVSSAPELGFVPGSKFWITTFSDKNYKNAGDTSAETTYAAIRFGEYVNIKADEFKAQMIVTGGSVKLFDSSSTDITDSTSAYIGSTCTVALYDTLNNLAKTYLVTLKGDVNGDGYILTPDVVLLRKYTVNTTSLTIAQKYAGDINKDGYVLTPDVVALRKFTVNTGAIDQTN